MTAYVILKHAREHPDVLQETITFSQRADKTVGSTSGVATGESLTVNQLMYGLMLPSGNDASVALAEHFGERLNPDSEHSDPLPRFVEAMNAAARQLGMQATHFENPHGLTAMKHKASAQDLVKLTHAAWQLPKLRKYVGTTQFGCKVTGKSGYSRNVMWKNSNRLLAIEGYQGVKTGTTTAAGACLISRGSHGDRQLTVVILGASGSDARYADARNLYRWAWGKVTGDR